MRIPGEMVARLDDARGVEPRASFVKRALESALGSAGDATVRGTPQQAARDSAPTRAPEWIEPLPPEAEALVGKALDDYREAVKKGPPPSPSWRESAWDRQQRLNAQRKS